MKSSKKRPESEKTIVQNFWRWENDGKWKTAKKHLVKTEKRWKMNRKEKTWKNTSESKNEKGN